MQFPLVSRGHEPPASLAIILDRLSSYRRSESRYVASPVDTLVATILSQNTSDVNSDRAYHQLRATFPTWDEVADADQQEIAVAIRCGGLARQKSRTIITALRSLRERYGTLDLEQLEKVPDDELLAELTSIRGIGIKTAACVLMFSLDRDICAVDTHIHRVANRLGIVRAASAEKTFVELRPLVPPGKGRDLHVSLIRFGRAICRSQRPRCGDCPLYDLCDWEHKEACAGR